jgi:UDP-N-acetylglucosamine transferase subunit ALG13
VIFVTVGTSFPFDRLIKAIDAAVQQGLVREDFFAQIGKGGCAPRGFPFKEILDKKEFDACFAEADAIISHAGMGTISMALEMNKPILVMPRLKKYKELVNNHQLAAARKFTEMGHVLSFYEEQELPVKILELKNFKPVPRICNIQGVSEKIAQIIEETMKNLQDAEVPDGGI